ncbi:DUF4383 domain-containing protein [Labedaea rhizosphaerae]|uniref:Uncharacterized protein DUF4383 n=1 Tax=Labedaea rhizosphaerae TaxID=598644 RepID=A0A4R6SE56_LABRH|nr:DUF4383 domain-containing protein [Labedaea rhizosphaerae]TDQ00162.1 uncharacterized protein DUF4383 [Labedaea rhizosphaerae]
MARARTKARIRRAGMQPVQVLAGIVALALLVLGIVGFNETGVTDWSSSNVATVIGFHMTAGRSLIYVLAGAIGILMALLAGTARLYGWLLMIGFAALILWGLAVVGTFSSNPVSGLGNPLHLAVSDNWWHAGGLVLALLVVALPARRVIVTDEVEEVDERPVEPVPVEPAVAPTRTDERDDTVMARPEHEGIRDTRDVRDVRDRDTAMTAHTEHGEPLAEERQGERMAPMPAVASDEGAAPQERKHKWNPFNRGSHGTTPGYR